MVPVEKIVYKEVPVPVDKVILIRPHVWELSARYVHMRNIVADGCGMKRWFAVLAAGRVQ